MTRIEAAAYATLTDPVEDIVASMDAPPYWAVIHPSGAVPFVHGKPRLMHLQRAVGGYLEAAAIREDLTAYCNEEGKLDGLAPNLPATRFLDVRGDVIAGPVVVIGPADREGNDTALPADVRMRLVRELIEA